MTKSEMKKILITGGAGYIGSHTVYHLIDNGFSPSQLIVLDDLSQGHKDYLPEGVIFEHCDLKNADEVLNIFSRNQVSAVIHFAGSTYVGESMENPAKYFENNVVSAINLLNVMVAKKCRKFIFSSTCAIYGTQQSDKITESHPQVPINPYGEAKLIIEKMLDWYSSIYGLKSVSLRYFNASGAGYDIGENHVPETHIIPLIFDAGVSDKPIYINGSDYPTTDGTCIRDYIHVLDLAEAHLLALKYLDEMQTKRESFNLGAQQGVSILQLVKICSEITGINIKYEMINRRAGDPPVLVADSQKAGRILRWKAQRNIEEVVSSAWGWYQSTFKKKVRCE